MALASLSQVSIRYKLMLVTGLVILVTGLMVTAANYVRQRGALLRAIDEKLLVAAHLAAGVPPTGYFDRIQDRDSVTPEEFARIVERNNQLCRDLDLQYLWSCMVIDGEIVFTTSTSPSKQERQKDHAAFLEVHRDPHAFDTVFSTMKPDFSSFYNEWGHGRMVLVPALDSHGRKYCCGASVSVNEVHGQLRGTLISSAIIFGLVMMVGLALTAVEASALSRPLAKLTDLARHIARGDLNRTVDVKGSAEVKSLSESIGSMSAAIRETIDELRREIVERQDAEEQVRRFNEELEQRVAHRTAELAAANKELEAFCYSVSHDLRAPLRSIDGFSCVLLEDHMGQLDENGQDHLQRVRAAAQRMGALIDDILRLSRITRGNMQRTRIDLSALAQSVVDRLRETEPDRHVEVTIGPDVKAMASERAVDILLENLIGNAWKFTSTRRVAKISFGVAENAECGHPNKVLPSDAEVFFVRDNGVGFEMQYADKLFGPFQRLHSRELFEGSGIGLATVQRIVARHGGVVWAHGEVDRGATFFFTLG
jgi:signal transduction histidine kinase